MSYRAVTEQAFLPLCSSDVWVSSRLCEEDIRTHSRNLSLSLIAFSLLLEELRTELRLVTVGTNSIDYGNRVGDYQLSYSLYYLVVVVVVVQ